MSKNFCIYNVELGVQSYDIVEWLVVTSNNLVIGVPTIQGFLTCPNCIYNVEF